MKISKLTEHIGHGTHMFHVSVCTYDSEGDTLLLVAANHTDHALAQGITHVLGLGPESPIPEDILADSQAYEIGEIEP